MLFLLQQKIPDLPNPTLPVPDLEEVEDLDKVLPLSVDKKLVLGGTRIVSVSGKSGRFISILFFFAFANLSNKNPFTNLAIFIDVNFF